MLYNVVGTDDGTTMVIGSHWYDDDDDDDVAAIGTRMRYVSGT